LYELIAKKQQNIGAKTTIPYPIKSAKGMNASTRNNWSAILFIK